MPTAVPAIPPKPKIAAIIAITKNVNADANMINPYARDALRRNKVYSYFLTDALPLLLLLGSLPTVQRESKEVN
jgi:hypothetical protein